MTAGRKLERHTKLYMSMPLRDLWKLHEEVISALAQGWRLKNLNWKKDWSGSEL
jgi:hypothetical protein